MPLHPADFIAEWKESPWRDFDHAWDLTREAVSAVAGLTDGLPPDFRVMDGVAIHKTARVEDAAVLKAPCIIGPECLVAHHAYLRGGVWLSKRVTIGPSCEVKSSFVFSENSLAHLSFLGDCVVGSHVNIEAGAVIANRRNECADKRIKIEIDGQIIDTGQDKFGTLFGDRVKVGANAVIAPGAALKPDEIVDRLALINQRPA